MDGCKLVNLGKTLSWLSALVPGSRNNIRLDADSAYEKPSQSGRRTDLTPNPVTICECNIRIEAPARKSIAANTADFVAMG